MSMRKRALASGSSDQPSPPKRPCVEPIEQELNGSERKLEPRSCLIEEDGRSELREELEPAKSHSAKDCRRANGESTAKNDARNLQLQFQTKLSLPVFTGEKLQGVGGASISVALVDANTGQVVTLGLESSIKLDVVVLEGDFNKDDEDNWAQEEFENYIVKEREGKGPLLTGDLVVMLEQGLGELGEMIFNDDSSWTRSKSFRIGLKVTLGNCGNTRIREAITDAFPVKQYRREAHRRHYPPACNHGVRRLEKIAKDGLSHRKRSLVPLSKESDQMLVEHGHAIVEKPFDNSNDVRKFNGGRARSVKQMQSYESETSNGLAGDLRPKSLLTEENPQSGVRVREESELIKSHFDKMVREVRSHFREELKLVKSHLADLVSGISNTLKEELVPAICSSLEDTVRGVVREELEHGSSQSVQLVRSSGKCRKKDEVKNLQLQFKTKLPASFFTGEKLKGEHGIPIDVKLVNADTGNIVESGPESSVKLKVAVLQGDFETDDDSWTQEEFEKSVVRERKGKRPLIIGNLQVILNGGTGVLGELEFSDNSSWTRSKKFRLGLQASSGYCENICVREAITEPFNVKENRGQSNEKHDEPAPGDEVWRLKNIGRNGPFHMNLEKAGICNVRQFRQLLEMDPEKLRKILGPTMKKNKWDKLREHAETCCLNGNPHLSLDNESDDRNGCQLTDHTADQVHCAADKFSPNQEEHGDTIMNKTFVNWDYGKELNDETGSMQEKGSSSFPSQVSEGQIQNLTPVQHNLAPGTCTAPVGPEAPPANAGSTAEGNWGITAAQLLIQSQSLNPQNATLNQMEPSADTNVQPLGQPYGSTSGFPALSNSGSTAARLPIQPQSLNSQPATWNSIIGGLNQMEPSAYTYGSFPGNSGITSAGLLIQLQSLNSQNALQNQITSCSNQKEPSANTNVQPYGQLYGPSSSFLASNTEDDQYNLEQLLEGSNLAAADQAPLATGRHFGI